MSLKLNEVIADDTFTPDVICCGKFFSREIYHVKRSDMIATSTTINQQGMKFISKKILFSALDLLQSSCFLENIERQSMLCVSLLCFTIDVAVLVMLPLSFQCSLSNNFRAHVKLELMAKHITR